jgi:hypothetical protein
VAGTALQSGIRWGRPVAGRRHEIHATYELADDRGGDQ